MRKPVKVYLFGSENNGWALDTDLALTRESLLKIPETVELTSLARCRGDTFGLGGTAFCT
jgi:hypothetical protein